MSASTYTSASPYWMTVHIRPVSDNEYGYQRYEYSPVLLAELERKWFYETWEADSAFNRARIERLERLARMLHCD